MNGIFPGLTFGKATRDAYGEALRDLGGTHPDIVVLDADLAKSTKSFTFGETYPERFWNVGIQEANMVGMAGGFASSGKVPFISSFAAFVILKGYDQLRMAVSYPKLNVKVCGSHGGISIGEDGASQQSVEDIALACALPDFVVCVPCDEHQMRAVVQAAYEHDGPVYIRSGRPKAPLIYDATPTDFRFGKATRLREGGDVTIIAYGLMVAAALVAHEELKREGIEARVVDMATVKPLDVDEVRAAAADTGAIVTAEEHLLHGGLGARVAQAVVGTHPVPMEFVGLDDTYAESGDPEALMRKYGLTAREVVDAVRRVVQRKSGRAAGLGAGAPR
ncbi:MAG TPA: transketolase C-terminal domain-containing protein [Longimicrobiales bacterium]|nr:transketolase C-terminal domain-containing protein [Longimicrobiales bacterium]